MWVGEGNIEKDQGGEHGKGNMGVGEKDMGKGSTGEGEHR